MVPEGIQRHWQYCRNANLKKRPGRSLDRIQISWTVSLDVTINARLQPRNYHGRIQ